MCAASRGMSFYWVLLPGLVCSRAPDCTEGATRRHNSACLPFTNNNLDINHSRQPTVYFPVWPQPRCLKWDKQIHISSFKQHSHHQFSSWLNTWEKHFHRRRFFVCGQREPKEQRDALTPAAERGWEQICSLSRNIPAKVTGQRAEFESLSTSSYLQIDVLLWRFWQ